MKFDEKKIKTEYMKADTALTDYMPYPCFLLGSDLSRTARELYALLLHQANLSRLNGWVDDQGRVFLIYTLKQLSGDLGKSITTIKSALNELCAEDLLERSCRGRGLVNHLYVKLPPENLIPADASKSVLKARNGSGPDPPVCFPSITGSENCPQDSRKSDHDPVGNLTPSKKKEKKDKSYFKRRYRDYSYQEGESL